MPVKNLNNRKADSNQLDTLKSKILSKANTSNKIKDLINNESSKSTNTNILSDNSSNLF